MSGVETSSTDDQRVAQWVSAAAAALTAHGVREPTRSAILSNLMRDLAAQRAGGRDVDELLWQDAARFVRRAVAEHRRVTARVAPLPMAVTGLLGAVAGAWLVWFGLFRGLLDWLPAESLEVLALVLFLDVVAVAIVLGGALFPIAVWHGRWLPVLLPRLAVLGIAAALLAWPAISGFGYTTGYAVTQDVLAVEVLIGAGFLVAAILTARAWALRADVIHRARLAC